MRVRFWRLPSTVAWLLSPSVWSCVRKLVLALGRLWRTSPSPPLLPLLLLLDTLLLLLLLEFRKTRLATRLRFTSLRPRAVVNVPCVSLAFRAA